MRSNTHPLPFFAAAMLVCCLVPRTSAEAKSSVSCPEIAGVEAALKGAHRAILLGEIHGTAEAPELALHLVCHLVASGRSVTVALEWPFEDKDGVQAYLSSPGGPAALEKLLALPMWDREWKDGRHSQAMLNLIEELRLMNLEGRGPIGLVTFDSDSETEDRERGLARRLARAMATTPRSTFLVLTGNLHNRIRKGVPWNENFVPMALDLNPEELLSLEIVQPQGTAWMCRGNGPSGCSVHAIGQPDLQVPSVPTITLYGQGEGNHDAAYHGRVILTSATASPPALGSEETSR